MEKIPEPKKIIYPSAATSSEGCSFLQLKLLRKVNEIVGWINDRRTLAEMSPEEIEKIGKYIQELDKREWGDGRAK